MSGGNTANSAYAPYRPARRPGGRPSEKPAYRVLVHHKFKDLWDALPERVGIQNAERVWDHLAQQPGLAPLIGQCTKMKGMAKFATNGWSPIYHYEISSMGRLDYQFHQEHQATVDLEPCKVVRILRISLSSH